MRLSILPVFMLAACGGGNAADDDGGAVPDGGATTPDAPGLPDADAPPLPTGDALVFVTSNFYDGDLKTAGNGADGLDGADKLCQLHAAAASLPGTYRAWLSTKAVDAIDRITGPGPWKNTAGEIVFGNRAQLQTHPMVRVAHDEAGELAFPLVWTGTHLGREAPTQYSSDTTSTCEDWTSRSYVTDTAAYGDSNQADTGAWTKNGYRWCDEPHALYCFSVVP